MNKSIITIIIALAAVCGCQKTEKTIYRVPLSEHAMELERQEKAYNDSIEKYSAPRFLLSLHPGGKGKQSDDEIFLNGMCEDINQGTISAGNLPATALEDSDKGAYPKRICSESLV